MKTIIINGAVLILACFFFSFNSFVEKGDLRVEISGLRSSKGSVLISLFKDGNGYPSEPEKAFKKEKLPISGNKAIVEFKDLPAGNYAAVVLHDENNNLKMDKTLGIPKEGYGFSNNVMGVMGPPSFSKAGFEHKGKQVVVIQMKY